MTRRPASVDRELGALTARLDALAEAFEKESDKQALFRKDFHIGFDALSAAVRTLTDFMTANKPLMDDKILKIEMPWVTIRDTSERGISEYVLST